MLGLLSSSRPAVLEADFVSQLIGNIPVKSFSVSKGANKGDNVIAKMLAITVETEGGENLPVVVKSLIPLTGEVDAATIGQSMFFVQLRVFDTEMSYYESVRPVLKDFGYVDELPRFYSGVCDGVNSYIVLEDLRAKAYKMADKKIGLDLEHVNRTLRKLAHLHGSSYAAIQSGDERIKSLLEKSTLNAHIWKREIKGMDQEVFFNTLVLKMAEIMRIHDQSTAERMKNFYENGYKIVIGMFDKSGRDSKYFRVINHGDLWTNNILFKYDENESIEDVTFIDYQQSRFGNIYEDLLYFIFTSTTAEFRKKHLRQCLITYYNEFASVCSNLGVAVPCTEEEVINVFYENLEYALAYELIGIPFQLGGDDVQEAGAEVVGKQQEEQQAPADPGHLDIALMMCEAMKAGTLKSPIAIQRLKELCEEMIKLNVM